MKTLNFKVTLLSDVIINQRAATEGNQKTLDFIPGNAFLGVAAGELYKQTNDESFTLFHSGKVRFGDAHPLVDGKRTLKVPTAWFFPKGKDKSNLFVHHGMPKPVENKIDFQPKQCRDSFIVKSTDNTVAEVEIDRHFAIKSAYDSEKRRSEDAKMYGYESLQAGSEWCFEVVLDDDMDSKLDAKLVEALVGKRRIGRSSTAQFGLIKIDKIEPFEGIEKKYGFSKWKSPKTRDTNENVVFVYAESRLIFFDENGQPTFVPTTKQLGLDGGEISWEMSQVRTFQYAPYNNKRQTRDADRLGFEKGSVFCITGTTSSETEKWVGSYQNEGFGKALINPEFLEFTNENGKSKFRIIEKAKDKDTVSKEPNPDFKFENQTDTNVWKYLIQQSNEAKSKSNIYSAVNKFVDSPLGESFEGKDKFASQWGTIRSIAMQIQTKNFELQSREKKDLLIKKLFEEHEDPVTRKKTGIGYLKHGVAKEKWEGYKVEKLEKFIEDLKPEETIEIVINLAAEMAKKCRRD